MIIKWIINLFRKRKKVQIDTKNYILEKYENFKKFYNNRFDNYCCKIKFNIFIKQINDFKKIYNLRKRIFKKEEQKQINNLISLIKKYQNHEEFNKDFIIKTINSLPKDFFLFKTIVLDNNQITSIFKEDKINLVIAGAGSGKTTTILGKIKYLVEISKLDPKQILVLSYSNKSVNDFNERIKKYLPYDIKARTIHAFSQSITTQVEQKKYNVSDKNIQTEAFINCLNKNLFKQWYINFIAYYWDEKITDTEIEEIMKGHKPPFINNNEIFTLNNERVKSSEEAKIANFFFLNGINYKYEKFYEINTWTESYVQYKPDFYLVDYKIYWEHFGLDKNNNTMWKHTNPSIDENYKKSIKWKIELHKKNNTKLIQSFSYELRTQTWKELLTNKLKYYNIELKPISLTKEQLKELINNNKDLSKTVDLFNNLINLYEEYELTPEILKNRLLQIKTTNTYFRIKLILNIFFAIWNEYNVILKQKNVISFAQIIKRGYENLKKYHNPYQYLIIDEFQDVSPLRMKLINQLLVDQQVKKFYFVGDDWQSIYGFSGSRVELFTNLLKHSEASVSFINNTYRNSQQLIEITSKYITKDNNMIHKYLQSKKEHFYPIIIYEYKVKNSYSEETNQSEIVARLIEKHYQEDKNYEFLILARTNISIEQLWIDGYFYQKNNKGATIFLKNFPQAKIKFITVHGSKGLEADFVFVLNVSNHLHGLPSQIINDPVCSLFENINEEMNANEERRIFYVALTRTKNIVYLLTESGNYSPYIDEIKKYNYVKIKHQTEKEEHKLIIKKCPICQIKLKSNNFYVSCPNYKLCGMTIKNKDIDTKNIVCYLCKWVMVLRISKYGHFYLCINVNCKHKVNVSISKK
ncbi:MAG: UvrD-helicase domain-containing protein [Spiroplasma ixodetis]|nr:UvrD-helicase domain-containing protein [Spiroplasma ixodetis]MBP1528475.1 UvrD-helicase domain-containing protein [Spiroplasma ixodetis]